MTDLLQDAISNILRRIPNATDAETLGLANAASTLLYTYLSVKQAEREETINARGESK